MRRTRAYARHTEEAVRLVGLEVAQARRARRWTIAELAERGRSSVATVRRVERGDPSVAIGTVFELALVLGVPLFGEDRTRLDVLVGRAEDRLALMPARVRVPTGQVHDDF